MTTFAHEPVETADGSLARAHLAGDQDAFAVLFRRYYPDLVAFLRYQLRDHALAEDVAQETLARALKYLTSYDATRPIWPWLKRIAHRAAGDEARRRAGEVIVTEVEVHGEVAMDLSEVYVTRDVLARALRRIDPRHQRALVMRYAEDRHAAECAEAFELSRGAFEQLLHRARKSLAREYAAVESGTPRRYAGLAALPLTGRLRDLVASWQTRLAAGAEAAMAVAGNVAIGLAIVAGGTTLGGSPATVLGTGLPPGAPAATDADAARGPASAVRPGAVAAQTARTTTTTARPASPPRPDDPETVEVRTPPTGLGPRGRVAVAKDPLAEGRIHENEVHTPGHTSETEVERTEGQGTTCIVTHGYLLCD